MHVLVKWTSGWLYPVLLGPGTALRPPKIHFNHVFRGMDETNFNRSVVWTRLQK